MRRSSRAAAKRAKQKAKEYIDFLDAPDSKVLAGALPPPSEKPTTKEFNRLKPEQRKLVASLRGKRQNELTSFEVAPVLRHILFMNVGDERILEAQEWLIGGGQRPPWTQNVKGLEIHKNRLALRVNGRVLPFALKDDKRQAVKNQYYDPKKPSTIQPITDALRHEYCNISRKNVRNVLRSLETYQLMYRRRKHPKIEHHTLYTKPGILAMDTFFPSANTGWKKRSVLCCMDVWSRFSRAYALERNSARFFEKAMDAFFKECVSLGIMPRRLLTDKGTELLVGTKFIEKFRLPRDKDKPMHLKSFTGSPVQVIENMNAQYQRRLEIYRIADIQDDPADLLWDISEQLNNQKRARRGNLTPYQLLRLDNAQRNKLNAEYDDSYYGVGVEAQKKLPPLKIGDHVRKLEMTYKDQEKSSRKGFQEKWSRRVYQVLRTKGLNRNKHIKRYAIGDPKRTYFRHELLKIPKEVDQKIIKFPTSAPLLVQDWYTPS